jgi:hypothetical protein
MLAVEGHPVTGTIVLGALVLSVLSVALSIVVTVIVLVRLPVDAFLESRPPWPRSRPRLALRVGRNMLGWAIILLGLVLSIPGVPGQGILTILMGLLLVDFPGRGKLLRRLLARPAVRERVNRLRIRFGRPPFSG